MAATQRTNIPAELRSVFSTRWLNAAARESGLVVRLRKGRRQHSGGCPKVRLVEGGLAGAVGPGPPQGAGALAAHSARGGQLSP